MLFHRTGAAFFCSIFASLALLSGGCNNAPDSTEAETGTAQKKKGGETQAEKCRRKLAAAIRRLDPERLTMQSDPERSISGLNSWIASCASDQCAALKLSDEAIKMLNGSPRATGARYSGGDALYIRDAIMMRELHKELSSRGNKKDASAADRDVNRILKAFEWVVRNISIQPVDESRPPLGLFAIAMTGRGTAEDRAWAFAELLRQQQTDAVIVTTEKEAKPEGSVLDTATWLVAVLQDDTGWLFDMVTGLPVTDSTDFDPINPVPVSLDTLKEHDRWKDSSASVIAQVATFSPRMLVLQDSLAADDAAVLFEELTGGVSEIRPLVERVVAAGGDLWTSEKLSVWPYPEERVIKANSRSEDQQGNYKKTMRFFEAPFERDVFIPESPEEQTSVPEQMSDEERQKFVEQRLMEVYVQVSQSTEKLFGKPSFRLLKARTRQVMGSTETRIIQQMQQIRLSSLVQVIPVRVPKEIRELPGNEGMPEVIYRNLPDAIVAVNQSATGNSLYWTALSQIDRGEMGMAISTLKNYRKQYPTGKWKYPSLISHATALLAEGRKDEARKLLGEANVDENPEQLRVQRLLKALGDAAE